MNKEEEGVLILLYDFLSDKTGLKDADFRVLSKYGKDLASLLNKKDPRSRKHWKHIANDPTARSFYAQPDRFNRQLDALKQR